MLARKAFKINEPIRLYADGSGNGGWACIMVKGGVAKELSGKITQATTNNRMELLAVIEGLNLCHEHGHYNEIICIIDSNYVKNGITSWIHNWKRRGWVTSKQNRDGTYEPVANRDLWELLDELVQMTQVTFQWTKGHAGNHYNERCDQLAKS